MDISVVIPLLNEAESLPELHDWIKKVMEENNYSYEIMFIDDGSTDNSWEIIQGLQAKNPNVRGIRFRRNYGKSPALNVGFKACEGDVIITMDADLQNNPADIPLLLEKMDKFDVVCGWRFKRNDPWIKRVSSKIGNAVRNNLSQEEIADTGCSLKAFRRECFNNVKLFKGMHRFFPTLMKMEGFRVTQVKVSHHPRLHGESKYNIRNRLFSSLHDLMAIRWMKKRQINYDIIEED